MLLYKIKKTSLTTRFAVLISSTLLVLVYVLAYTATGLAWMLNSNISDPSASITISSVSNKLDGTTTLYNLRYQSDFTEIQFDRLTIKWNPLSIFTNQLVIEDLSGEYLSVNFKTGENDTGLTATLAFPISTNVIAASIKGLEIQSNGETVYTVAKTVIDNIYLDDSYFAESVILKSADGQWVKFSGQFGFSASSVINLTTESSLSSPSENTSIRAKGTMVGNAAQLRFLQHVSTPFTADISGRIKHLFTNPSWVMDTKLNAVDLSMLTGGKFLKKLSGDISVSGQWNRFEVNSDLTIVDSTAKGSAKNSWTATLVAHSAANLLDFEIGIKSDEKQNDAERPQANFSGSYDLHSLIANNKKVKGLKFTGKWHGITLPLDNGNAVVTKAGSIEFDGSSYVAKINAKDVQFNTLGPTMTALALNTAKDSNGELVFNAVATSSNGKIQLSGSMVNHNNNLELDNLFLSGTNFPLVRKPQAHIIVSPNISFVRKGRIMTSTGSIDVPTANIQLQEFKNTLASISSIIDSKNAPFGSTGYVDVKFGNAVWLHGYGLNAHVTGELSLLDISNRQLVASGELNVLRGNYRELNKEHPLSGGRLTFNYNDLDNPQLELNLKRASTSNQNKITGSLQKLYKESSQNLKAKSFVKKSSIPTPVKAVALMTNH